MTLTRSAALVFALTLLVRGTVAAQTADTTAAPADTSTQQSRASSVGRFFAGAGIAFAAHEGGHLLLDVAFDAHPRLVKGGLALRQCARLHLKAVIVDGALLYLGSANWTGAGLGAKGDRNRNFELGFVT